jgi:hypothetical protein
MQNDQIVRAVLTEDAMYRKKVKWPLISFENFHKIVLKLIEDDESVTNIRGDSFFEIEIKGDTEKLIDRLNVSFPCIKLILKKHRNKIALCGGSITRLLRAITSRKSDADIFFYNCTETEATEILKDSISTIIASFAKESGIKIQKIVIQRNENVTNLLIYDEDDCATYQFIHRIYPTLDSIIGGFDLGASALALAATDFGIDIYGTPLGAWTLVNCAIIVDTTRRSISFEKRIIKYARKMGFSVIFPGLSPDSLKEEKLQSLHVRAAKVYKLMQSLGLYLRDYIEGYERKFESGLPSISCNGMKINEHGLYDDRTMITGIKEVPKTLIDKYSDYEAKEILSNNLAKGNATLLRANNLSRVCVQQEVPLNSIQEKVISIFADMIENPVIEYDVNFRARIKSLLERSTVPPFSESGYTRRNLSLFAEFLPQIRENISLVDPIVKFLSERMHENAKICKERLKGIKWITKNPQRQWTSSINPIMEDSRIFYGEYYTPFWIGIPDGKESILRLIRKCEGSVLFLLSKDLFELLLEMVVKSYCFNI